MKRIMTLDPQVQEFVDEVNATGAPSRERSVAEVRADFYDLSISLQDPGVDVGRVEDRYIPGPHGPIRIRLYWPEGSDPTAPPPGLH